MITARRKRTLCAGDVRKKWSWFRVSARVRQEFYAFWKMDKLSQNNIYKQILASERVMCHKKGLVDFKRMLFRMHKFVKFLILSRLIDVKVNIQ